MAPLPGFGDTPPVSDTESPLDYLRRRASEELAAAERSEDERVRRSHLEMARRYEEAAVAGVAPIVAEAAKPGLLTPEFRVLD
jgi:hypothetical protein